MTWFKAAATRGGDDAPMTIEREAVVAPIRRTPAGRPGKVWLVGAGPGDVDLLTVKAARLLSNARVVLYDHLVGDGVLALLPAQARRICVGKRSRNHSLPQEEINALLVRLAEGGDDVVRLKGGDPYVFGRGAEEALALAAAGIAFEVVPGITSAQGMASYAGIPLTHRGVASSVVFATGHCREGGEEPDWAALARPHQTVVIYMGLARLDTICRELMAHGLPPDHAGRAGGAGHDAAAAGGRRRARRAAGAGGATPCRRARADRDRRSGSPAFGAGLVLAGSAGLGVDGGRAGDDGLNRRPARKALLRTGRAVAGKMAAVAALSLTNLARALAIVAGLFGIATLVAGSRVLLGADPGYVVYRPLLVFNTVMGAAYLVTGVLAWFDARRGRRGACGDRRAQCPDAGLHRLAVPGTVRHRRPRERRRDGVSHPRVAGALGRLQLGRASEVIAFVGGQIPIAGMATLRTGLREGRLQG